jgi:hypothetical protein
LEIVIYQTPQFSKPLPLITETKVLEVVTVPTIDSLPDEHHLTMHQALVT